MYKTPTFDYNLEHIEITNTCLGSKAIVLATTSTRLRTLQALSAVLAMLGRRETIVPRAFRCLYLIDLLV